MASRTAIKRLVLLGPVPPPYGGVQTHMMALRERALARGMDVHVLNLTRHRTADLPNVLHPQSPWELLRHVRALRPDVLHLHAGGVLSNRIVALLGALTVIAKAPVHFTFHSGGFPTSAAGRKLSSTTVTAIILRRLARVIGVNAELTDFFERLGVSTQRVSMLRPDSPIVVDRSSASNALQDFARRASPFLLSVGGMEPVYQVSQQIRAMNEIAKRWPGVGMLIVGSGSELAARQAEAAASPNAQQLLLPGDVPHVGVLALMSVADAVLRPTAYDGDAISVREALQLGRSVVATRTAFRPAGVYLIDSVEPQHMVDGIALALNGRNDFATVGASDWSAIDAIIDGYT